MSLVTFLALLILPKMQKKELSSFRPLEELEDYLHCPVWAWFVTSEEVWVPKLREGEITAFLLSGSADKKKRDFERALQSFQQEEMDPLSEVFLAWNFWRLLLLFHPSPYGEKVFSALQERLERAGYQTKEYPRGVAREDLQQALAEGEVIFVGNGEVLRTSLFVGWHKKGEYLSLPFSSYPHSCPVLLFV